MPTIKMIAMSRYDFPHDRVVQPAGFFAIQQHGAYGDGSLHVFLDIARVVGEHDQARCQGFQGPPKAQLGSEQPGKNLVACQRDKAAHNDAADRFSKREIGNRRPAYQQNREQRKTAPIAPIARGISPA